MINASYYYRVASYMNAHPEELPAFFESTDSLEVFANIIGMLKPQVRALAVKIASRLIINIARQIADTGYRSGRLKLVKGFNNSSEIEIDHSIENCLQEPEKGLLENIVSFCRHKERNAFVIMIDHSYSMKGMKVVLAAITAASIAQHFKRDYAIITFNNRVTVLKDIDDEIGPDVILKKLFNLELNGDTDIRAALLEALKQVQKFEHKKALLLTDGAWNQGGDPLNVATQFDKLNVIAFPPAQYNKIKLLALKGRGEFSFVDNERNIASAIIKCLN